MKSQKGYGFAMRIYTARWPAMDKQARKRAVRDMENRLDILQHHSKTITDWLDEHRKKVKA